MQATLYIYVPPALLMKSTYSFHKGFKKLQLLFTMLLLYMCQQQICPSNATYEN